MTEGPTLRYDHPSVSNEQSEADTTPTVSRDGGIRMAVLVRAQGNHPGKWVYPVGRRCALGRHSDCDVADIFADNNGVSRFHALVEFVAGQYTIEDSASRNGTYLNDQRISGRTQLRSGDRVAIGGVELMFLEEADVVGTRAQTPASLDRISFAEPDESLTLRSSLGMESPLSRVRLNGYSDEKLRALVQMLKCLGRSLDIDATLQELLHGLFTIFPQAQSGFVAFMVDGQDDVVPRATQFRDAETDERIHVSRTLVRHVLSQREAVLWATEGPATIASRTLNNLPIRSLLCAPLLDADGNPFGVVQIDTDQPTRTFTAEDLEVMVGAVTQTAVAVRFAELHEKALSRQAFERDLELARRVQLGLLPEGCPDIAGFDFFAYYRAAYDVGGDYYDFIELPDDRLALVIADAAGKGVSAALLMAKLSGEVKYHLSCKSPGHALAYMNESLCAGNTGRFVTLLVVILNRRSPMLTIVNAGHPAPLRRQPDGTVEAVGEPTRGAALGIMPGEQYPEMRVAIEPADLWLAYTDGFSEAMSRAGTAFGSVRLRERLATAAVGVRESGDRIVHDVMTFLGDQPQSDDMCLVGWGLVGTSAEATDGSCADAMDTTKVIP